MTKNERIPFDEMMCIEQFTQTLGFVAHMQGESHVEAACAEAERLCAELFDKLWSADDRTEYMTVLGYLAMDLAANVAYTLDRARIMKDVNND